MEIKNIQEDHENERDLGSADVDKNELSNAFEEDTSKSLDEEFASKEVVNPFKQSDEPKIKSTIFNDEFKKDITKKLFEENTRAMFEKVTSTSGDKDDHLDLRGVDIEEFPPKRELPNIDLMSTSSPSQEEIEEMTEARKSIGEDSSNEEFRHEMIKRRTRQGKCSPKVKRSSVQPNNITSTFPSAPVNFNSWDLSENLSWKEKIFRFIDKIIVRFIPTKRPYQPKNKYSNVMDALLDRIANDRNYAEFKRRFKRKIRSQTKEEIAKWKDFDKKIASL